MNRKLAYPAALLVSLLAWPLPGEAQLGGVVDTPTSTVTDTTSSTTSTLTDTTSTGSLVVSMTSPASGSTVSGTRTVSASVSIVGSLTVSRVEFFRDGTTSLGADTTNPYSVSWNTTTTSNGSHTLKAVARDILGVSWNSNTITVTVSNDTTRPSVAINQAAGQPDPTNASPINFTAVFSEPVSGFTNADVTITGTAGGTKTVAVTGGPSTYTVAVSGMTSSGTVLATIAAGVAQDAAGNANTASTSTDNQVVFDATAPAPPSTPNLAVASDSGVSNTDNLTNDNTPTFTGTAEAGSTVKIFSDGIQVGSGTATGGSYSITTSPLSDGVHSITARATDTVNNVSSPSDALSVTFDTSRPTVRITSPTAGSTVGGTILVSAEASDNLGVVGVQFFVDTTTLIGEGTTNHFSVTWDTTKVANGPHTLTAVARDAAGNQTTSASVTVTVSNDTTRPTVTINQAAGQPDPTNASPINFTAVFSEPVSGFTNTDVTVGGTAGGTKTVAVTGGPSTYNVAVSGMTNAAVSGGSTVTATIQAGVAQDAAGNLNTASTSTDNTVTFETAADTTPPTITSFNPTRGPAGTVVTITGTNFTGATAVTFNGVSATQFAVDSATSIRAQVPAGATTGLIRVTTPGGTATSTSDFTVEGAPPPPTGTRFEESAEMFIGAGWVQIGPEIATFSGGFAASSDVAGDTASFTFTGTKVTWIGLKCNICGVASVSIDEGAATTVDTTGTAAIGSPGLESEVVFTSQTLAAGSHTIVITVTGTPAGAANIVVDAFDVTGAGGEPDTTPPTVTINQAAGQLDPTNSSPISFTAVFSEPVNGFTNTDVTIGGTAGGTKTVVVTGGPSTYNVAVSGMTSGGTVIATVAAGVASDAAGNTNSVSTSTDNTVTFTTTTGTVARFEEDNAAISYSPAGAWVRRGPEIAAFSGGIAVSSDVAGATATFTFSGTAVSWIGLKCSVCGIASVSIDRGAATSIDTAGAAAPGSPGLASEVVFTASGLADGSHTMVITVTGTTTSAGAHIIVDAFDVTGTGGGAPPTVIRIEETDPAISYTGNWFQVCDPRASGGCGEESIEVGAQATLSFSGTGVRWIGWRNEGGGIANVYVDGILKGEVDTFSPTTEAQAEVFTALGLPRGTHTLTIEVTGSGRNPATGTWIIIDAFDVTP